MQINKIGKLLEAFPELEEALENLLLKDSSGFDRNISSNLESLKNAMEDIYYEEDSDEALLIDEVESIIDYHFTNEKLLIQAFTRRGVNLDANNQALEFMGDKVLDYVAIRNLDKLFCEVDCFNYNYKNSLSEGEFTKIKERFVSKDFLASRADELGLSKFIFYSRVDIDNGMQNDRSPREDLIEAIIGAVAIDSNWDYEVLDKVVDTLLDLGNLKAENALHDDYDKLRSWSQKNNADFSIKQEMLGRNEYKAIIHIKYKNFDETVEYVEDSRIKARVAAGHYLLSLLESGGYLYDIRDSKIEPKLELAVNQLQELFQKKYISEPQYDYKDNHDSWFCTCLVETLKGSGPAKTKIEAKKAAAFDMLNRLFEISSRNK